jgi:hypothetical protein
MTSEGASSSSTPAAASVYESEDSVSGTSRWVVGMPKDTRPYRWYADFLLPSSALTSSTSWLNVLWRSKNASSGSPYFKVLRLTYSSPYSSIITTISASAYFSGGTYLGAGKVHKTTVTFTDSNHIQPSYYIPFYIERENNASDTLNGDVEILNVIYGFDTDDSIPKQFIWIPNNATVPDSYSYNSQLYTPITLTGTAGNGTWSGWNQPNNTSTYILSSIIPPSSFNSSATLSTVFVGANGTNQENYKFYYCSFPIGTVVSSSTLPFTLAGTASWTEVSMTPIIIFTVPLTGAVAGNQQLFLKIVRSVGLDPSTWAGADLFLGASLEWTPSAQVCSLGLLGTSAAVTSSGYAASMKVSDTNSAITRNWIALNPGKSGASTINFTVPDNYGSEGRYKIYYTTRCPTGTAGYASLRLLTSVAGTGTVADHTIASSGQISLTLYPGNSPNIMLEYIDTQLPALLTAGSVASLHIIRQGDTDTFPYSIDISEILLEYSPVGAGTGIPTAPPQGA